jgi:hypothetical protein
MTASMQVGGLQASVDERRAACVSLPVALGQGLDYADRRSFETSESLARPVLNRNQPTWSADSAAALRSASPRNTVPFSPAMRAVGPVLP